MLIAHKMNFLVEKSLSRVTIFGCILGAHFRRQSCEANRKTVAG